MDTIKLKHTLRNMKREEIRLYGDQPPASLVYSHFFDHPEALYPMNLLVKMDQGAFRMVLDEYWAEVLYTYFKSRGITDDLSHDPQLLKVLGLSIGATDAMIKKRFRQLAHHFHPDHGGSAKDFIDIKEAYDRLLKP